MRRSPRAWRLTPRRFSVVAVSMATAATVLVGPASSATAAAATVTVQPGDTLTKIAAVLHTTVAALVATNHLSSADRVFAGQVLVVPPPGASTTASSATASDVETVTVTPAVVTVVVQRGDTLTRIATRQHTTVAALVAANHLSSPDRVLAGQVLVVPPAGTASASPGGMALVSYRTPGSPAYPAQLVAHPSRLALVPDFASAAATYGVPVALLEAMCWWESGWQATVVSSTGAIGVCQIEPRTAAVINQTLVHTPLDPHVAAQNIDLGAAYLAFLLRATGGDVGRALAGYYQGLASVNGIGMLPSTVQYVRGIEGYAAIFGG